MAAAATGKGNSTIWIIATILIVIIILTAVYFFIIKKKPVQQPSAQARQAPPVKMIKAGSSFSPTAQAPAPVPDQLQQVVNQSGGALALPTLPWYQRWSTDGQGNWFPVMK